MITISIGWFAVVLVGAFGFGLLLPLLLLMSIVFKAPIK